MGDDNKKKIEVEIKRKNGVTIFKFKIDPHIENMYKSQVQNGEGEIKESTKWEGLKFYFLPNLLTSEAYQNLLLNYRLFDDYGQSLYRNGKLNIAWLRTEGGKGEVELKEELGFSELSSLVKNAMACIREHFDHYYRDFKITGSVSVEI